MSVENGGAQAAVVLEELVLDHGFRQVWFRLDFEHEGVGEERLGCGLHHARCEPNVFLSFEFHIRSETGRKLNRFTTPILRSGEFERCGLVSAQDRSEHQETERQVTQHGKLLRTSFELKH